MKDELSILRSKVAQLTLNLNTERDMRRYFEEQNELLKLRVKLLTEKYEPKR